MLILTLLLLSSSAFASVTRVEKTYYSLEDADKHFEYFIKTYNKQYASEAEKLKRFEIFKENLEKNNRLNADPRQKNAVFGITKFSDLTLEEFQSNYMGYKKLEDVPFPVGNFTLPLRTDAPENFDWRDQGVITQVKDQGSCGACWAFSTTGGLEAAYAIKHRQLVSLSEQQLVDCDTSNNGCGGGQAYRALSYLQGQGAMGEDDYPYTGVQGQCSFNANAVRVQVAGQQSVDLSNEDQLRQIVSQHGPVCVNVNDAGNFQGYVSGIQYCPVGFQGHAVLIVGYGIENGDQYWLIKNSWGAQWGEAGYIRVRAGNNPCGMYGEPGVLPYAA